MSGIHTFLHQLARIDIAWADGPGWGLALGVVVVATLIGGTAGSTDPKKSRHRRR